MNNDPTGSSVVRLDGRRPLFSFSLPRSIADRIMIPGTKAGTTEVAKAEFDFFMFSVLYWIELLMVVLGTISLAAIVGLILYHTVIKAKQEGSTQAYIVGWGFILPFWATFSFFLIEAMDIQNCIFRFMIGCISIICAFRTTEVIYGFAPDYVKDSASKFCFYYATIPIAARFKEQKATASRNTTKEDGAGSATIEDKCRKIGDPIPCSSGEKVKHLVRFKALVFATGAYQSFLGCYPHYGVFQMTRKNEETKLGYSTEDYFMWQLYANSALQALFFQLYLTTYMEGLTFLFTLLSGYKTEPIMHNPLMKSQSPMEFWGRRWNLLVHTVLKNGVYKPVRKLLSSQTAAILTTFLSSGAFHEWLLSVAFDGSNDREDGKYRFQYGGTTVFFLWQALLIGLELTIGKSSFFQRISRNVPPPLKTIFVVGMGIPFAHLFLEPYLHSNFFGDGALGLPMIVPRTK